MPMGISPEMAIRLDKAKPGAHGSSSARRYPRQPTVFAPIQLDCVSCGDLSTRT